MSKNYTIVTEIPGNKAPKEQLERLFQRYHFAQQYCENKAVLEVACGSGMGLGYLARTSRFVVGGDIDKNLLNLSVDRYRERENIYLNLLDGQSLPFSAKSFDVVLLFEAIYYLPEPEKFISEARRVLKKDGCLLICTANKDWTDFNPSPYSQKYFGTRELHALIEKKFSRVEVYGAFPVNNHAFKNKTVSKIKRTAISFNIMPKTMKSKEKFKRLFFGKLFSLPIEIHEGIADYFPPVHISSTSQDFKHKVIFSVAYS